MTMVHTVCSDEHVFAEDHPPVRALAYTHAVTASSTDSVAKTHDTHTHTHRTGVSFTHERLHGLS